MSLTPNVLCFCLSASSVATCDTCVYGDLICSNVEVNTDNVHLQAGCFVFFYSIYLQAFFGRKHLRIIQKPPVSIFCRRQTIKHFVKTLFITVINVSSTSDLDKIFSSRNELRKEPIMEFENVFFFFEEDRRYFALREGTWKRGKLILVSDLQPFWIGWQEHQLRWVGLRTDQWPRATFLFLTCQEPVEKTQPLTSHQIKCIQLSPQK